MRISLLTCAALVASHIAMAAPATAGDQAGSVAAASVAVDGVDLTANLEDQMDEYAKQSGLGNLSDSGELQVLRGSSTVLVSTSDPKWVAYRAEAYKDALLNADAEFIKSEGEQVTAETTREFYLAAHQEPPPFDKGQAPGQTAELIRKLFAVGNAQLDAELQKLDVDPKQYAVAPEPQQHVQLRNAISQQTIRRAIAGLVGVTPVQTFEGNDGQGHYRIGVIAVVSSKMREFAQQVLRAHGEFEPDIARAQDLKKLFGGDRAGLLRDFGVRRMFDKNGLPVIVSFAQWIPGGAKGDDPSVADAYRQVAFSQVESQADAQISDFLAGSAEFNEQSILGQSMMKVVERLPDDYIKQDAAMRDLTSGLMQQLQTRSHINLTGIETVRRWTLNHPVTGQPVVGIIRMWSAARENQVRKLRDGRADAGAGQAADAPHEGAAVKTGNDYMRAADF